MQAIQTKYHGPTAKRGSVIKATCAAGSIIVPYDSGEDTYGNHRAAADALVKKLGWERYGRDGRWERGGLKDGSYVHVARS